MDEKLKQMLSRYDQDPGAWRPLFYGLDIDVGLKVGAINQGSVNLNNQPYILTRITHQIIGDYYVETDPMVMYPMWLFNDGQYSIEWKDEQSNYTNTMIPADLMFGTVRGYGGQRDLPFPIPFAGNKTITFRVMNLRTRTPTIPLLKYFRVSVCLCGVADWGDTYPLR